jgi:Mn-containing catalase
VPAAAAELQAEGAERLPALSNFPQKRSSPKSPYQCQSFSDGAAASEGSWAKCPSPDGNGEFTSHDGPTDLLSVEKVAGLAQDKLGIE